MDLLNQMDTALFKMIAGNSQTWSAFMWFGIFCAKYLIYIIPIHLLVLWFCGGAVERRAAFSIFLSVCIGLVLSYLAGKFFFRPRPFVAGLGPVFIDHRENASFPSNHALIFAVYTIGLYLYRYKAIAKIALVLGLLTCWGRVFVGVHYPFDIIGGVILGGCVSWFTVRFIVRFVPAFIYQIPPLKVQKVPNKTTR